MAATVERRTGAAFTSRCERRNVDVDARVYAAASNAASGANGERHQVRAASPRRGDHPEGAASNARGCVAAKKYEDPGLRLMTRRLLLDLGGVGPEQQREPQDDRGGSEGVEQ